MLHQSPASITRDAYFRVRGNGDGNCQADSVYVLGNIVAGSDDNAFDLDSMVPVVRSSVGVAAYLAWAG